MKPRICLLDAGPVIELHRLGIWEAVVDRTLLIVPSIVAREEALFWDSGEGIGRAINLVPLIESGTIEEIAADIDQLTATKALFDPSLVDSIHAGELEALSILRTWPDDDRPAFCTGDRLATIALCLLGFSTLAVSLEELLDRIGLGRELGRPFQRDMMKAWIEEGTQRLLRGEGLKGRGEG